jgi:hypothetical protein
MASTRNELMTKEELKKLLHEEIEKRSDVMLEAWLNFERNPSARTFRDAENIPHNEMLRALDSVTGKVTQNAISEAESSPELKKTEETTGIDKRACN